MLSDVTEEELSELYAWVDTIPLSRPKKSIARDFADGVCVAEIVHHYFPRLVQLHNYSPASNSSQKIDNWTTLNQRVFKKLGLTLPRESFEAAAFAEPGAIERVLKLLRAKLAQYQAKHGASRAAQLQGNAGPESKTPTRGTYISYESTTPAVGKSGGLLNDNERAPAAAQDPYQDSYSSGNTQQYDAAPGDDLIRSFRAKAVEAELEEVRALNHILEVKAAKLEQLLRLKDAKIVALTARLEGAGLLSP